MDTTEPTKSERGPTANDSDSISWIAFIGRLLPFCFRRSFDTLLSFLGSSPSWRTALVAVPSYTTAIELGFIVDRLFVVQRGIDLVLRAPTRSVRVFLSLCGVKDTQEPGTGPDSMTQKEAALSVLLGNPWSDETSLSFEWNTVSRLLTLHSDLTVHLRNLTLSPVIVGYCAAFPVLPPLAVQLHDLKPSSDLTCMRASQFKQPVLHKSASAKIPAALWCTLGRLLVPVNALFGSEALLSSGTSIASALLLVLITQSSYSDPYFRMATFTGGTHYRVHATPPSCKKATGIRISMDYILVMLSEVCSLDAVPQLPASARPVPAKALGFRPPGWISESTRAAVMRSDSLVYQLFSNSLDRSFIDAQSYEPAPILASSSSSLRMDWDMSPSEPYNYQASTQVSAANRSSPFTWTDMPWAAGDDSDQTVLSTDA
ncbi:hypothetical protein C8R46DRAFT_1220407 [Mycena filopes]|nr:hypothetical protein C8R46DRAFT_1220407 [Mycena filopes]